MDLAGIPLHFEGGQEELSLLSRYQNGIHSVKDMTMGEDKSFVQVDHRPKILSALRNTVIGLLHHACFHIIAVRMCYNNSHPEVALAALTLAFFRMHKP